MHFFKRSLWCAAILSTALAACGQGGEGQGSGPVPADTETAAAPAPADFNPCNTTTFAQVQTVIGTPTTISSRDISGTASPGWATCTYGRADRSAGPVFTVRVARFENSAIAMRRHQDIVGGLSGAQSIAGDANNAAVWVDGSNIHLQYQSGWWIVRRTIEGQSDAAARERLLAVPRWPNT
jgi:hypothetical protein